MDLIRMPVLEVLDYLITVHTIKPTPKAQVF